MTLIPFLPIFFAHTGLRTRIDVSLGRDALMILVVAVAGKWLGAMLAALGWHGNALRILMNARGLVELVILSIGPDLGLITPPIFSMMLLMALATTLMTAPLVRRVYG